MTGPPSVLQNKKGVLLGIFCSCATYEPRSSAKRLFGAVQGVRIPRKLHTGAFWDLLEQCAKTSDERIIILNNISGYISHHVLIFDRPFLTPNFPCQSYSSRATPSLTPSNPGPPFISVIARHSWRFHYICASPSPTGHLRAHKGPASRNNRGGQRRAPRACNVFQCPTSS